MTVDKVEGLGVDEPLVALVHEVVAVKHLPKGRATGSHHIQIGAELCIGHGIGGHGTGFAIHGVVVEDVGLRELQLLTVDKHPIAVVAVGELLVHFAFAAVHHGMPHVA